MEIKCIWFDIGGVLTYFDLFKIGKNLSAYFPLSPAEINSALINCPEHICFLKGLIDPYDFYEHVLGILCCDDTKLSYDDFTGIWQRIFRQNIDIVPILTRIKTPVRKMIISNTDALHWNTLRQMTAVNNFFCSCGLVLSFKTKAIKPEMEIFQKALEASQVDPMNILYIDDNPVFLAAAVDLGCITYLFNNKLHSCSMLESKLYNMGLLY